MDFCLSLLRLLCFWSFLGRAGLPLPPLLVSLLLCLVLLFVLGLFGVLLRLPSPLVPHGVWWLISGCPRLDIWLLRQRSGRLAGLRPAASYTVVLSALMEIVQVVCFATLAKVSSCPQMGCVGTLGLTKGFFAMTFIFLFFRVHLFCSSCVMLRLQTESRELAKSRPLRNSQGTPTFPNHSFGRFLTLNSFGYLFWRWH